ncbi:MAG: hypothetical protein ACI4VF_00090 [Lachnospirales bacterium]
MSKTEAFIFNRVYQSYLTGGDTYSFIYKTDDPQKIEEYRLAISSLEEKGFIDVLFQSDKKTRMSLTDTGIDYGISALLD